MTYLEKPNGKSSHIYQMKLIATFHLIDILFLGNPKGRPTIPCRFNHAFKTNYSYIYIYTVYNFSLLWSSALLKVVEFQYQPSYIFKWFDLTANHIKTLQLLKVRSFVVEKTCVCVCIQECTFTCNATGTVVRCGLTAVEKRVAREGNSLPSVIWNVNDFWEIFRNENLYIWWVSPNSNSTSLNHKSIIKTPILASIVSTNSI